MEIRYKIDNEFQNINFDHSLFINGSNRSGKTYTLKTLQSGFNGELNDFYINGDKVYKGDYNVIYIGDYNNFATDFKLTKSNQFKKIIYDEIIEKINSQELLKRVNIVLDSINEKVNSLIIENNIIEDNNLRLNIEIDSIDKIIEKFTNIYIDEYLLDESKTPRSTLRKLLYSLIFYEIKKQNDNTILIIDDVDNSLDEYELKKIIDRIENDVIYNNITFIVSSTRNIYSYIKNKSNIYKIYNNKLNNIRNIDECIKHSIILNEYKKTESKINFNSFLEENEYLINDEDINYFKNNILPYLSYYIGLMYCFNTFDESFLVLKTDLEKLFLHIIYDNLIDNV